jgi:hypothetical protein
VVGRLLDRTGVLAALSLGFCVGWLTCFLAAYAASKGIERDVANYLKKPIRATED